MQLAARTAAWAKSGGWKNPYITDGLVAMWDGEWNAGGGVHDPNATVWKDLSGNDYDLTVLPESFFNNDSLVIPQGSTKGSAGANYPQAINVQSAEIVVIRDDMAARFVFHSGGVARCILNPATGNETSVVQWVSGSGVASLCSFGLGEEVCAACIYGPDGVAAFTKGEPSSTSYYNLWSAQSYFTVGYAVNNNQFGALKIKSIRLYASTHTASDIAANYAIDKARFGLT